MNASVEEKLDTISEKMTDLAAKDFVRWSNTNDEVAGPYNERDMQMFSVGYALGYLKGFEPCVPTK